MAEAALPGGVDTRPLSEHIPSNYYELPVEVIGYKSRHEMCLHMNPEQELRGNDWREVASEIGCRQLEIDNIKMKKSPMEAVLVLAIQQRLKLGKLLEIIKKIERFDCLDACSKLIAKDVEEWKPLQSSEVSTSSPPYTLGELETGETEYFDAFVSYHHQDIEFIDTLIENLEVERGFKLCISDRDLVIGQFTGEGETEIILKRCKRVILILSSSYISDPKTVRWQLMFAAAIAPVAEKMHKLVPIIIESGITVPPVLLPFNASDYSRVATRQWFWRRVDASLAASTNGDGGFTGPSSPRLNRRRCNSEQPANRSMDDSGADSRNRSGSSPPPSNEGRSSNSSTGISSTSERRHDKPQPLTISVQNPNSNRKDKAS